MKPKSILDPSFRYTSSANTDIRKTFARARREMRREAVERQGDQHESAPVIPLLPYRATK